MRISTKGRYGLASMIYMAKNYENMGSITIISISKSLGISKIYLEQVFSLLKRAGLVISVKGSMGGYQLAFAPDKIVALEILKAVESSLFEKTEKSVTLESIEETMQNFLFDNIDKVLTKTLYAVTLYDLATESKKFDSKKNNMFYI